MITGAAIIKNPATVTYGAGTNLVLAGLGDTLVQKSTFIAESGVNFSTRSEVLFSVKTPKSAAGTPGGYTQGRAEAFLRAPKVLANLAKTVNTLRVSLATDVETTDAEKATMLLYMAQILTETAYAAFWQNQTLD